MTDQTDRGNTGQKVIIPGIIEPFPSLGIHRYTQKNVLHLNHPYC